MSRDTESRGPTDVGVDPFFTARVLSVLPAAPLGATLTPLRRLAVVVAAYAIAGGVGYAAVVALDSSTLSRADEAIGAWVGPADQDANRWAAIALPLGLLVVAFVARRPHTEAA